MNGSGNKCAGGTARTPEEPPATQEGSVAVSVLGYREDDEWCALALEMDLRGYGRTFREALDDLRGSMTMQIGFAHFKDELDMIFRPAESVYFSLYAQVRNDHLTALVKKGAVGESDYAVAGIPIPTPELIAAEKTGFSVSDG